MFLFHDIVKMDSTRKKKKKKEEVMFRWKVKTRKINLGEDFIYYSAR